MSRDDIDGHVRRHYEAQRLSPEARQRLHATAALPARPKRRPVWALAAGLLLAVGVAFFYTAKRPPLDLDAVVAEIAHNHRKGHEVDYASNDLSALAAHLDGLDFPLVWAPRLATLSDRILGARYCSVGGQIAAQISLRGAGGRPVSLYETRASEALETLAPGRYRDGDVEIELWQREGVLLALARSLPPEP